MPKLSDFDPAGWPQICREIKAGYHPTPQHVADAITNDPTIPDAALKYVADMVRRSSTPNHRPKKRPVTRIRERVTLLLTFKELKNKHQQAGAQNPRTAAIEELAEIHDREFETMERKVRDAIRADQTAKKQKK